MTDGELRFCLTCWRLLLQEGWESASVEERLVGTGPRFCRVRVRCTCQYYSCFPALKLHRDGCTRPAL